MVILAGGVAKRLGELTLETPKGMLLIEGKPFLHYQIEMLSKQGIKNFVFCIAHLGHLIQSDLGDGSRFGVKIVYSQEPGELLGTGGCLKWAQPLLEEAFMVMYGDSYLKLDYREVWHEYKRHPADGLMTVYRNENRFDRSNLRVENGFVKEYSYEHSSEMFYIDYGLSVLRRDFLDAFKPGEVFGLQEVFIRLIKAGKLRAKEARERFYEIGSILGLENFRALVKKEKL